MVAVGREKRTCGTRVFYQEKEDSNTMVRGLECKFVTNRSRPEW